MYLRFLLFLLPLNALAQIGVVADSTYPVPSEPAGLWTCQNIGAGTCDCTESSGDLTIVAAGVDQDNSCFAYQTVESGDIEFIWRILDTSDLTNAGPGGIIAGAIRDGLQAGNPSALNRWRAGSSRNVGNYRLVQDGAVTGGLFGDASYALSVWGGIQRDDSADTLSFWESNASTPSWVNIASGIDLEEGFTFPLQVGMIVASGHATNAITAEIEGLDLSSTITLVNNPPTADRDLRAELDWETGAVQARGNLDANGVSKDATWMRQIEEGTVLTITNISRANPAVMSYTGPDPGTGPGQGIMLGEITSGMTEISKRLVRCSSVNTSANTCTLTEDGDEYVSDGNDALADNPINSSGYTAWSGTTTGTMWSQLTLTSGGADPDSGLDVRVVTSDTPPDTIMGSSASVSPMRGDFYLRSVISRNKDYSVFTGNSNKNKPRFGTNFGTSSNELAMPYNAEEWIAVGIFLPSNFDHEQETHVDFSRNHLLDMDSLADGNHNLLMLQTKGDSGGEDRWFMRYATSFSAEATADLGSVAGDLGKWTLFIFRIRAHTGSSGILQIWKSSGGCDSAGSCTMAQVFDRTNASVGWNDSFRFSIRQYKFAWNHKTQTIPGPDLWIGFDEIRLGGAAEGTTYEDVHPDGASQP